MIQKNVSGSPLKILLVEDNPAHAELVIRSFRDHTINSEIRHVMNGELALVRDYVIPFLVHHWWTDRSLPWYSFY